MNTSTPTEDANKPKAVTNVENAPLLLDKRKNPYTKAKYNWVKINCRGAENKYNCR